MNGILEIEKGINVFKLKSAIFMFATCQKQTFLQSNLMPWSSWAMKLGDWHKNTMLFESKVHWFHEIFMNLLYQSNFWDYSSFEFQFVHSNIGVLLIFAQVLFWARK